MKKLVLKNYFYLVVLSLLLLPLSKASAAEVYTVQRGDTLWKIAVRYEIGISEIIQANPQFKNPNMIYPGDKVNIPLITEIKTVEDEVLRLVNIERANNGLPAFKSDWQLTRVARVKSEDMRDKNYFSHTSPTYGSPFEMMKSFNITYSSAGENIAKGQKTPKDVVTAWMNSPGHRKNILNPSFNYLGVGYAKSSAGTTYWTQMFIGK